MRKLSILVTTWFLFISCAGPSNDKKVGSGTALEVAESHSDEANYPIVDSIPSEDSNSGVLQRTGIESVDGERIESRILDESVREESIKMTELVSAPASEGEEAAKTPAASNEQTLVIDHSGYDRLLRKYVTSLGAVNYKGFNGDPAFDAYLKLLSDNPPGDHWSRDEKMAYWINAYNAFTIKLIIDNLPLESIKDITFPWKTDFFMIGGDDMDLNTIEHDILRPRFKDARIHFAIVCASASCPKLLNRAYDAEYLNAQLDAATSDFINDPRRNDLGDDPIRISKIFDWFDGDFNPSVLAFVQNYSNAPVSGDVDIRYLPYDWALND